MSDMEREPVFTVLVVEDDGAMRELLREALEEEGYEVIAAAGGREGLRKVRGGGWTWWSPTCACPTWTAWT